MKEHFDSAAGALRKRDEVFGPGPSRPGPEPAAGNGAQAPRPPAAPTMNLWLVLDLLVHRWKWLLLGAVLFGVGFYFLGEKVVKPKFTATAQLLRYDMGSEYFKTTPLSAETFAGLIKSPELLRTIGDQAVPPIPPEKLIKMIKVEPEPDSDLVKMQLAAPTPQQAVTLVNLYAKEAVDFTRDLQAKQAGVLANDYLKQQVSQMDQDITVLHQQFRGIHVSPEVTNKLNQIGSDLTALHRHLSASSPPSLLIARQTERLQKALGELDDLMVQYTDLHPSVQAKRAQIAELQSQIASASTNAPTAAAAALSSPLPLRSGDNTFNPELDIIRTKLLSLEEGRVQLANRQREAALYASNPPGVARVFAPAMLSTVQNNFRSIKVVAVAIFGAVVGFVFSIGLVMLVEFTDNRLKTPEDVTRVTRLPVLTTLGNLQDMKPEARAEWAFRAWTMLQGRLSPSANHGLVCGITSSRNGEGRSTWISLLAEAASMTGFRVLTIATKPSPSFASGPAPEEDEQKEPEVNETGEEVGMETPRKPEATAMKNGNNGKNGKHDINGSSLTSSVLMSPAKVTEQLTGPNSQPMVHIPLPGWVWNLERRKQWGEALGQWRQIDNLVILVELPPACVPEAVLLGSNLPNMVWLTSSGCASASETRAQLETLRHARCNLVGAVLNRQGSPSLKSRFPRWMAIAGLLSMLCLQNGVAQTSDNNSTSANPSASGGSFSIVNPSQRAEWQKRLTLGPGDVLNFGLYGQPELARTEVAVGPDGRVSYLEAQDVQAAGVTIDELREKFNQELGKFRRSPRVLITPVTFKSKRYYMLGKVMTKGVYTLDRPITVLEAIARAKGLENGLVDRNVVDLADFQRAFLMRGGKRYPLNFEKLFQEGDLSQNIAIEPGDYLYFPSTNIREVYVVGEVRLPGTVSYNPSMTVISAITARGGFTDRAFRARVLVVRGSLNHPETFAVDTHAMVEGKALNFKLQPKDIVYVNSRPFIRVEELADMAVTAFLQSLVTSWVGVDVVKPIQ